MMSNLLKIARDLEEDARLIGRRKGLRNHRHRKDRHTVDMAEHLEARADAVTGQIDDRLLLSERFYVLAPADVAEDNQPKLVEERPLLGIAGGAFGHRGKP